MTPRKRPLKEMKSLRYPLSVFNNNSTLKSVKIGGKMEKNMNPELLRARLGMSGEGLSPLEGATKRPLEGATKRAFSTI